MGSTLWNEDLSYSVELSEVANPKDLAHYSLDEIVKVILDLLL